MNKFFKTLSLAVLLIVFGCDNKEKKDLVVGTSADYPLFSFKKGKQIVGFDIDLANEIAKKLNCKLHIKDMNFSELIPALEKNKIDFAVSAITATPDREKVVDFSAVKYYLPKLSLVYTKNKPIISIKALNSKTGAVQRGSTMESFLKARKARIISFERASTILEALKGGKVDYILTELVEAKVFCSADKTLAYSILHSSSYNFDYAVAFPKGSRLRVKVDNVMLTLKVLNGFDRLEEKWFKHK
jgi:arginine/lysine/histidine transporter system substrate-binding protein